MVAGRPPGATARFVGRDRELATIADAVARSRAGRGRLVVVRGAGRDRQDHAVRRAPSGSCRRRGLRRGVGSRAGPTAAPRRCGPGPPCSTSSAVPDAARPLTEDADGRRGRPRPLRPLQPPSPTSSPTGRRDRRWLIVLDDAHLADTARAAAGPVPAHARSTGSRLVLVLTRRDDGDAGHVEGDAARRARARRRRGAAPRLVRRARDGGLPRRPRHRESRTDGLVRAARPAHRRQPAAAGACCRADGRRLAGRSRTSSSDASTRCRPSTATCWRSPPSSAWRRRPARSSAIVGGDAADVVRRARRASARAA